MVAEIKTFPKWGKITETSWIVVSELTALEIRNKLLSLIDSDDKIMVMQTGREAAWHNLRIPSQWLKNNLAKQ